MDLNRAVTFVRVVETGGFTRAAESLGMPASSVSRSVAKLEHELGVTLLERTTRHVALTDAGRAFFSARAKRWSGSTKRAISRSMPRARPTASFASRCRPISARWPARCSPRCSRTIRGSGSS